MRHGFRKRLSGTREWAEKVRGITMDQVHAVMMSMDGRQVLMVSQAALDKLRVSYASKPGNPMSLSGIPIVVDPYLPIYRNRRSERPRRWDELQSRRRHEQKMRDIRAKVERLDQLLNSRRGRRRGGR